VEEEDATETTRIESGHLWFFLYRPGRKFTRKLHVIGLDRSGGGFPTLRRGESKAQQQQQQHTLQTSNQARRSLYSFEKH